MKMRTIRIVVGILILIPLAFAAWATLLPLHGRPNVAIKVVGYTNDNSDARLAVVAVTNLSDFTILVYLPTIQMPAPTEPRGFSNYYQGGTNQWARFHSNLDAGASGSFTIPSPTIPGPWRLSFNVYSDFGTAQMLKRMVSGRRMPFQMESEWFESGK